MSPVHEAGMALAHTASRLWTPQLLRWRCILSLAVHVPHLGLKHCMSPFTRIEGWQGAVVYARKPSPNPLEKAFSRSLDVLDPLRDLERTLLQVLSFHC